MIHDFDKIFNMPVETQPQSVDAKQRTFLKRLLIGTIILIAVPYLFLIMPIAVSCLWQQNLSPVGDSLQLLFGRLLHMYWFFLFVLNILLLINARRQKNRKVFLIAIFLFISIVLPFFFYMGLMITLAIGAVHAA